MEQEPATEKEKQSITIEGAQYFFLQNRLMGGMVYANEDRTAYLRVHTPAEIAGELNITKELFGRGFPVPRVLGEGTLVNGEAYFVEESIGDRSFADRFAEETKESGYANDETFDAFAAIVKKYCEAQFNPANYVPHDRDGFARMASLANVLRNNSPSEKMKAPFMQAYEKIADRALELPWGYVQADLNAYNILPSGIIDFELASFGPVGYDALTNVYFGLQWPEDRIRYRFTKEQIARYVAMVDETALAHNLPRMSDYVDDFLTLKQIWGTAKDKESEANPDRHPAFWKWRVNVRDWCIKQYLAGERIDTDLFEQVGKGSEYFSKV